MHICNYYCFYDVFMQQTLEFFCLMIVVYRRHKTSGHGYASVVLDIYKN